MMPNILPRYCFALCITLLFGAFSANAQSGPGQFEGQADIGRVKLPGNATYDSATARYTLEGSGANIWGNQDAFHFLYKRMTGDFILRARVTFIGKGVEPHRKIGWMIRQSLDPGSPHVSAAIHGSGLVSLQFRNEKNGVTAERQSALNAANVVQLERRGSRFIMSIAKWGDTLSTIAVDSVALGNAVYAGLFICSHNDKVLEKAVFRNVRIIIPAKEDFAPYHDYIGSNIELMDVFSGNRKIIYQSGISLQAPNWTKGGNSLIYNSKGLMYRLDLKTLQSRQIFTGPERNINNDHVISFDGNTLGISNTPEHGKSSLVYTLPLEGGTPKLITPEGPSYLHGWSPDGKYLVFTGQRNGEFDIYRVPSQGGKEQRLTSAKGLDDGPEYSPDGKYIYFNSVRSGTMQIWRMKADGSDQQQMTHDDLNNWFPHVSPDGKWIVFISFPLSVKPDDHPFYKHVYLRIMPAAGGKPRVIAYVYGGQGTINTPSWSPDSKHIAFVSNTQQ